MTRRYVRFVQSPNEGQIIFLFFPIIYLLFSDLKILRLIVSRNSIRITFDLGKLSSRKMISKICSYKTNYSNLLLYILFIYYYIIYILIIIIIYILYIIINLNVVSKENFVTDIVRIFFFIRVSRFFKYYRFLNPESRFLFGITKV